MILRPSADGSYDVTDVRLSLSIVVDLNVKASDQVNGNRLTVPSIRAMFVSGGKDLKKNEGSRGSGCI